jgi:hypothetical protein
MNYQHFQTFYDRQRQKEPVDKEYVSPPILSEEQMHPKADAYTALPFHVSSTVLVSVPNMENPGL